MSNKKHFNSLIDPEEIYHKKSDLIINNIIVGVAVVTMIVFCGVVYYFTAQAEVNRGCEASAYQATKNGFDLETNLKACI